MEIITENLLLREITWDDLEDIHQLHSIPEVDEFNTLGIPADMDETREIMRPELETKEENAQSRYTWRITGKYSGDFIGLAGFILSNDKFRLGEIYYKLLPAYWGQGYATELAKNLIIVGFDKFHLHKVEAGVATGNMRSIRVLEKAGLVREGLRRKILPIRGEWKDGYLYAIVEDDKRAY
jgi:[ribosomal protein S5]-alanine N-acetyltransferase